MLKYIWPIFVFSLYSAAIAWLLISRILEKLVKKKYSFNVDMAIFACLFIVAAVIFAKCLF